MWTLFITLLTWQLLSAVHGNWTAWSLCGTCSVTCGEGLERRCRYCTANPCSGYATEYNLCRKYACAVHGNWAAWSEWGTCSKTCDVGLERRDRTCTQPIPGPHGDPCTGDANEYKPCRKNACAVHGNWAAWSEWGTCGVTCGIGLERRGRTCTLPIPGPNVHPCTGDANEYNVCLKHACADGIWSSWSRWGSCSSTCNGGMRARYRACDNPTPSFLGKACIGNSIDKGICNNKNCPNSLIFFTVTTPNKKMTIYNRPIFTKVVANVGGGYDMSTAVFTCPVAGLYMFSFTFRQKSTRYTYCRIFVKGDYVAQVHTGTNNHWASASGSWFFRLNKGDTFEIRYCDGWTYVDTGNSGYFTGALVIPS